MARIEEDQPLVPSVLDRLIDDDPSSTREAPRSRNQVMRDLRVAVRRDLENLLSTRTFIGAIPPEQDELNRSIIGYGLPDISSTTLSSETGRLGYLKTVERVISTYEPRLSSVRVSAVDASDQVQRTLRFRIDAMLMADPAPEPIVFDTSLEITTGDVEVRGQQD